MEIVPTLTWNVLGVLSVLVSDACCSFCIFNKFYRKPADSAALCWFLRNHSQPLLSPFRRCLYETAELYWFNVLFSFISPQDVDLHPCQAAETDNILELCVPLPRSKKSSLMADSLDFFLRWSNRHFCLQAHFSTCFAGQSGHKDQQHLVRQKEDVVYSMNFVSRSGCQNQESEDGINLMNFVSLSRCQSQQSRVRINHMYSV